MTATDPFFRARGLKASLGLKAPVRLATTANLPAREGLLTIDGVTVAEDDRILVKDQTLAYDNGIYRASSGAWSRDLDWDSSDDIVTGTMIFVTHGTVNGMQLFVLATANPISLGTTNLVIEPVLDAFTNLVAARFFLSGVGTTSAPSIALSADQNTGIGFDADGVFITINGTEAFRVDINKRVSHGYQPRVTANMGAAVAAGDVVTTWTEFEDLDGCFDPTTGEFTAQISGHYQVTALFRSGTAGNNEISMEVNDGSGWTKFVGSFAQAANYTMPIMRNLYLDEGEKFRFKLVAGSIASGNTAANQMSVYYLG